ncbi:MAG TPA: alpha/beta fold hydrolase [Holophagaceae bacterium]|nr:alpha/beta fold hydrolase [Holophagaceae bacterium]
MPQYVICARKIGKDGRFQPSPGPIQFLKVPDGADQMEPGHKIPPEAWVGEVRSLADGDTDPRTGDGGDVLIFIHGYNNDSPAILKRQEYLSEDLKAEGFKGIVVSFDWPSDNSTLNYLEDRGDAADTALFLVEKGIKLLARGQGRGCETNIHLLGHSTGAYVILEAFIQAEKREDLFKSNWRVGQVALIGGDIASANLGEGDQWAQPLFGRCDRVTNYFSGHDFVLAVSNAKRLGTSPRAGRVGAAHPSNPKVADVDCTRYFEGLDPKKCRFQGTFAHSWHIGNPVFARDLAMTLTAGMDRAALPTRLRGPEGRFQLQDAARPTHETNWAMAHSE